MALVHPHTVEARFCCHRHIEKLQLEDHQRIIAPFDLQLTFAPAIVYETINGIESCFTQNPMPCEKFIAGMSLEINAKSEILFTTSLNQISLISLFVQESITIYNSLLYPATSGSLMKEHRKIQDSGLDGCETSEKPTEQTDNPGVNVDRETSYPRLVPTELLITGSKISLMLFKLSEGTKCETTAKDKAMWRKYRYKHRRLEIMRDCREEFPIDLESEEAFKMEAKKNIKLSEQFDFIKTEQQCDLGYDSSEEGSVCNASNCGGNTKKNKAFNRSKASSFRASN